MGNTIINRVLSSILSVGLIAGSAALTPVYAAEASPIDLSLTEKSGSESWKNKNGYINAFDGDVYTYFDGLKNGYCQLDLKKNYSVTKIRFYPREGTKSNKPIAEYVGRMAGGVFGGSTDGQSWTQLYTVPDSIFTNKNDADTVKWYEIDVSGIYRYIKYENTKNEANIGEIEVYGSPAGDAAVPTPAPTQTPAPTPDVVGKDFKLLDRSGFSASSNSVQDEKGTGAKLVLDGKTNTLWHSKYDPNSIGSDKDKNPIYLTVDMGKKQSVSLVRYTPRVKDSSAGSKNGVITAYELYAYTGADETDEPHIVIGEPVNISDKTTVSVSVHNPTDEMKNGVLIAAVYNDNGECAQVKTVENGTAEFESFDSGYIKAFLWNSLSGESCIIPLLDSKTRTQKSDWSKIAEGNLGYSDDGVQEPVNIIFAPVETRYLRLVAKDNLSNSKTYVASCAEFNAYSYEGEMANHPVTEARKMLDEVIDKLNAVQSESAAKEMLLKKADELKTCGSTDGIKAFAESTPSVIDALGWADRGINDAYIGRVVNVLADSGVSAAALANANAELSGFYKTGAQFEAELAGAWQDEFVISDNERSMPLYERIDNAVKRARARIDSNDGKDYKMLKELVSYVNKEGYAGYENEYGMDAASCEAVISNINFALANLDKMDKGELSTALSTFESGEVWLDNQGSKISAHGGQIIKQNDTYYWYGEDNKISYDLKTGVSCYSSKDLKDWTYEGIVFKAFDDQTEQKQFTKEFLTDNIEKTKGRIERPKVIYNEKNNNYVMWMHLESNGQYDLSAMGVAVSDSPTGPFVWKWHGRPVYDNYVVHNSKHQFFRDMNLFVDDDKRAYLFASSENNEVMYQVRLNEDYTWIDADDLEASGTTEADICEGKVIIPDMRVAEERRGGFRGAKYTYGKKSFTRYQLANGTAAPLTNKVDENGNALKDENGKQILVSTRSDGMLCLPSYEDGRWAKVGWNTAEENKDYTKTETVVNNSIITKREAPAPIKIDGKYYLVTSSLSGWKANPSLTQSAQSVFGPWISTGNPMIGAGPENPGWWTQSADSKTSFNSQSTCIIQLPDGSYMYMGDRWKNGGYDSNLDVKASTYVWLPIMFKDGVLTVEWKDSWTYNE